MISSEEVGKYMELSSTLNGKNIKINSVSKVDLILRQEIVAHTSTAIRARHAEGRSNKVRKVLTFCP